MANIVVICTKANGRGSHDSDRIVKITLKLHFVNDIIAQKRVNVKCACFLKVKLFKYIRVLLYQMFCLLISEPNCNSQQRTSFSIQKQTPSCHRLQFIGKHNCVEVFEHVNISIRKKLFWKAKKQNFLCN